MDVKKFIRLVKNKPILYDRRHKDYFNLPRKAEIWNNIAKEMKESRNVLRVKWKGLKDGYKKYQKQNEDVYTGPKTFSRWRWAKYLKFLDNCSKRGNTAASDVNIDSIDTLESQLSPSQTESTCIAGTPPLETEIFFFESAEALQNDILSESMSSTFKQRATPSTQSLELSNPSHIRGSYKRPHSTFSSDEGESFLLNREKRAKSSDAIDLLFKSYAETFKSFSLGKQVSLKVQLAKLFANAEVEEMQGSSNVYSTATVEGGHDYALSSENGTLHGAASRSDVHEYDDLKLEETLPSMKHSPDSDRSSIN